mmetsp:Transcript_36804/g.54065  ORF Transcript_36804/g.54065 Transcript_36804/m.54065 type:complete len:133 (+) Transcript_36804:42-440(+)|eukprot:CAMPEP_0195516760 /NCGR_PEP_ID=MMETSP0794_2-20130614/8520_1 /TAXON_ID=515487 /ORGANISM="Stephanopyxis turris, Strain CCMP 815" /LENGTH=132 /DNA_ID=CAMNT_0040645431 /DNA_START=42 /DNA_END=440 /DNA_ORIENTATION=+
MRSFASLLLVVLVVTPFVSAFRVFPATPSSRIVRICSGWTSCVRPNTGALFASDDNKEGEEETSFPSMISQETGGVNLDKGEEQAPAEWSDPDMQANTSGAVSWYVWPIIGYIGLLLLDDAFHFLPENLKII